MGTPFAVFVTSTSKVCQFHSMVLDPADEPLIQDEV